MHVRDSKFYDRVPANKVPPIMKLAYCECLWDDAIACAKEIDIKIHDRMPGKEPLS